MERRGYVIPHSTIHHGIKEVAKKIEEDNDYQVVVDSISALCIHY
jgi:chromosomal replication initiation ATPase DnaA